MKRPYWKWSGKNEFIPGIPARDMTEKEVADRKIEELVEMSPLFTLVKPKTRKAIKGTKGE